MTADPHPSTPPCQKCNGTGLLPAKPVAISLVTGRGANFYKNGRYASGVKVDQIGTLDVADPCPDCAVS